jgi:hypothetical protein
MSDEARSDSLRMRAFRLLYIIGWAINPKRGYMLSMLGAIGTGIAIGIGIGRIDDDVSLWALLLLALTFGQYHGYISVTKRKGNPLVTWISLAALALNVIAVVIVSFLAAPWWWAILASFGTLSLLATAITLWTGTVVLFPILTAWDNPCHGGESVVAIASGKDYVLTPGETQSMPPRPHNDRNINLVSCRKCGKVLAKTGTEWFGVLQRAAHARRQARAAQ